MAAACVTVKNRVDGVLKCVEVNRNRKQFTKGINSKKILALSPC